MSGDALEPGHVSRYSYYVEVSGKNIGNCDRWGWDHYIVSRYQQPITQRRGVASQKNWELKYSPAKAQDPIIIIIITIIIMFMNG